MLSSTYERAAPLRAKSCSSIAAKVVERNTEKKKVEYISRVVVLGCACCALPKAKGIRKLLLSSVPTTTTTTTAPKFGATTSAAAE